MVSPDPTTQGGEKRPALREWLASWWATYVHLSRRQRREIAKIVRYADEHDFTEVERPS